MDPLTFAGGLIFLAISVLSVYRPDWVWGRPLVSPRDPVRWQRMRRRRMIGTVVYFAAGAALLILSVK